MDRGHKNGVPSKRGLSLVDSLPEPYPHLCPHVGPAKAVQAHNIKTRVNRATSFSACNYDIMNYFERVPFNWRRYTKGGDSNSTRVAGGGGGGGRGGGGGGARFKSCAVIGNAGHITDHEW